MKNLTRSVASLALLLALSACKSETPATPSETVQTVPEKTASIELERPGLEKKVEIKSVPEWSVKRSIPKYPEARHDQTRNGIEYLLFDDQYRYNLGGYEYASRAVFRVSDRKGLEAAAQIKKSFDPTLSNLSFNYINIIRDGKTVDRLPVVEIREIQQESGLGKGIIDGDITALINLEDVRVGDIIDYSYSGQVTTPLYPDMFFTSSSTSYSVPVARTIVSIDMPHDKRLYSETIKSKARVKIKDVGDRTLYTFDLVDPEPHRKFSNIPDGVVTRGSFQVSTQDSWSDIADWAVDVYDIDLTLPKAAHSKIKSIRKANKSDGDKAMAALQWVQDDVRYLGFEEGVNGHKPRTPAVTLANGYGDCKDKSVLLQAALTEMGITSYVALVSTTSGELLDQVLPSITMFNHAIVVAEIDGRNVYFDPTGTYQRGSLEGYGEPDYGFVLPIKPGQSELVEVDIPFEAYPTQSILEKYTYEEDGSLSLNVEAHYNKRDADSIRRKVAQQGIAKLTETYHDYYAERYPGLAVSENIKVMDDETQNKITLIEAYVLDAETVKSAGYEEKIEVKAYSINNKLPDFIEPGRDFALALNKGVKLHHEIQIVTPGREFPEQEDVEEETSGVDFMLDYQSNGEVFSLVYDLEIQEDRVELSEAKEIIELAEQVQNLASRSVNLKFAKTPLYKRLDLKDPIDETIMTEIQAIVRLIQEEENVDALERTRKLAKSYTNQDALRGFIQNIQASVLVDLDRPNAALPIMDEAFSLFEPLDQGSYFSYAGLQNSKENYKGAAETMTRVFKTHPKSSVGLRMEWMWPLYRNLKKNDEHKSADMMMIALAESQLENLDDIDESDRVFGTAILAMGRQEQVEKAKALYPYIRDASTFRDILMDRDMEALWEDASEIAGEGLKKIRQAEVDFAHDLATSEKATYQDFATLISAYLGNDQSEEAIAFGKPIYENWDRLVAEGRDGFWFANAYATALWQSGDLTQANAVFDKLMSIGVEQEGELVSMGLNQLINYVGQGDFKTALDKANQYHADENFSLSDYGKAYLLYVKACSEFQLGETEAGNATYDDEMAEIADENPGAKTLVLACLERDDAVAETLRERLESQAHRDSTIPIYVTDTVPLDPESFRYKQIVRINEIANRPDVKKVFDKYGRSISVTGPSEIWGEF